MGIEQKLDKIIAILEADFVLRRQGLQRGQQAGLHAAVGGALGGYLGAGATDSGQQQIDFSSLEAAINQLHNTISNQQVIDFSSLEASINQLHNTISNQQVIDFSGLEASINQLHNTISNWQPAPPSPAPAPPIGAPPGAPPAPAGMPPSYMASIINAGTTFIAQGAHILSSIKSGQPALAILSQQLEELATTLAAYNDAVSENLQAFKTAGTNIPAELVDLDTELNDLRLRLVGELSLLGGDPAPDAVSKLASQRRIRHDSMIFPPIWQALPPGMQQAIGNIIQGTHTLGTIATQPIGATPTQLGAGGLSGLLGSNPMKPAAIAGGAAIAAVMAEARKATLRNTGGGIQELDAARRQAQASAQHPGGMMREGSQMAHAFSLGLGESATSLGRNMLSGLRVFG